MDNTFFNNMYPGMEYEERLMLDEIIKDLSEEDKHKFLMIYQGRRQDSTNMLIFILIGLLGLGGIHRFIMGQIGMGILYLLTCGICYIGTIVDAVNYKTITLNHNREKMLEVAYMMRLNVNVKR